MQKRARARPTAASGFSRFFTVDRAKQEIPSGDNQLVVFDTNRKQPDSESGPSTFGLSGAETASEACRRNVPLEALALFICIPS